MQGFYPPSDAATLQTLTNGPSEVSPLNGYQYVTVNGLTSNAPDIIWIAGDQSCPTMTKASQAYYNSSTFLTMKSQLQPFYNKFEPLLQGVFEPSQIGFQSAFNIFDYLNVGYLYNATIYMNLSSEDLFQLRTLADAQSFDLVYNTSCQNASIGGMTVAGMVLTHLNQTVSQSNPQLKVTYYAGAYTVMLAFWGLSGLTKASPDFMGLPDYASTMTFELRRPIDSSGFDDLVVRFGFRNGSLPTAPLNYFPMFASNEIDMPWSQWSEAMANISILSDAEWCSVCDSSLMFCTGSGSTAESGVTGSQTNDQSAGTSSSSGLSNAAAGGIGAGVTIGVIAIIEGLAALWYFGLRRRNSIDKVPSDAGSNESK